jgi:hypothetical protein
VPAKPVVGGLSFALPCIQHTVMRQALLILLLALGPQGHGGHTAGGPSVAAEPARPATAGADVLERLESLAVGAWRGEWRRGGAPGLSGTPLEVAFSRGVRPSTLLAYFTFIERDGPTTVRRLGLLAENRVRFALADGRAITLHARGEQLVGDVAAPPGTAVLSLGAIELMRIRR